MSDARDAGIAKLLESVLNQVLSVQATEQLRAEPYERTKERQGYRNGTYPHTLTTRIGTITLRVPRLRSGKFSTELFCRYQRSEQAFILALMDMVVNGVSTRRVAEITEELCGTKISKSLVSNSMVAWCKLSAGTFRGCPGSDAKLISCVISLMPLPVPAGKK